MFRKSTNMCCTKQTIYLIDKCYNYSIKTQSRCGYSCADSQVGQPVADTKVIKNSLSFLKRMWSAIRFLQGGQQSQPDILCVHRSS